LSLSVLYFLYVAWVGLSTGEYALVVPVDLQWTELVAAYPVLLAVAVVIGYLLGKVLAPIVPARSTAGAPRRDESP
jgi:hypothetical protein